MKNILCLLLGQNLKKRQDPVELKSAMKNALLGLQSQLKVPLTDVEEAQASLNYGKGKIEINKSCKKITNLRKSLKNLKDQSNAAETKVLKKIDLGALSEQAIINSPVHRYIHNLNIELRDIQKQNKAKINQFRKEQIKNSNAPSASSEKKYLTFKTFFDTLEKAKQDLKVWLTTVLVAKLLEQQS